MAKFTCITLWTLSEDKYMMKLIDAKPYISSSYRSDLTKELDELSGISKAEEYERFYHYIVADTFCKRYKCLAIRVPGGTVGGITYDENNIITDIHIVQDYVVKTYPKDIDDIVKKYVGEQIEFRE